MSASSETDSQEGDVIMGLQREQGASSPAHHFLATEMKAANLHYSLKAPGLLSNE